MAQRGRGAAAGARAGARTGGRPAAGRDGRRTDTGRADTARTDAGRTGGSRVDASRRGGRADAPAGAPARRPGVDLAATRTRLRSIIEPVVTSTGFDLEDLSVVPAGRRLVVRVTVDGDEGISHDELTVVSREVAAGLDAAEAAGAEFAPDSYTLEVSSPGVDRPLTLPRHWRRNRGRLVKTRAADQALTARIVSVDEHGVTLDADGREVVVAFADLGPGRVEVEFARLADVDEVDEDGDDEEDHDEEDEDDDEDDDDEEDEPDDYEDGDDEDDSDDDIGIDGVGGVADQGGPQQKEDGA